MLNELHIHIAIDAPQVDPASVPGDSASTVLVKAIRDRLAAILSDHSLTITQTNEQPLASDGAMPHALIPIVTGDSALHATALDELRRFRAFHADDRDLPIRRRIFPLIDVAARRDELPGELHGLSRFELAVTSEHRPDADGAAATLSATDFWLTIEDIAFSIRSGLESTDLGRTRPAVFLAEPSPDLAPDCHRLRRELQRHGYPVLMVPPGLGADELRAITRNELGRAEVAVHMIGTDAGRIPEGTILSIVELQYQCTSERVGSAELAHLVWIPPSINEFDPRMERLASDALGEGDSFLGAEVVRTSLEDLKSVVFDILGESSTSVHNVDTSVDLPSTIDTSTRKGFGNQRHLYLIHDNRDAQAIAPLAEHLERSGLRVVLPELAGDHTAVREGHFDRLRACDAALIFYGDVGEQWVRMKQQDLRKVAGYGRARDVLAAVYLGCSESPGKQRFQAMDLTVIRNFGQFIPETLDPFVEQVRNAANVND